MYTCKFSKINPLRNGSLEAKNQEETYPLFSQTEGNKYSGLLGQNLFRPMIIQELIETYLPMKQGTRKIRHFFLPYLYILPQLVSVR